MAAKNDIALSEDRVAIVGSLVITTLRDGKVVRKTAPMRNKVVSSDGYGRNLLLRQVAGDALLPIVIDSASIGDDNTAPADADTDLGNPLVTDIPITNMSVSDNVLTIDVFVSDANLPDDTYEEFGLFMAGLLFSHVLISPSYTKASRDDTLFTYTLTLTG
jgi:hypothetical protein